MNEKKKIKEVAEKYNINAVYLFGSQARGNTTPLSDFDFAIQFHNSVNEDNYFDLKLKLLGEFSKIFKTDKIDLIILNGKESTTTMKYRVIKDGKIIYVKNDLERCRKEYKILSNYFDRQYYSNRYINHSLNYIASHGIL